MGSPQRIALFDAVGTVICPNPGVTEVYYRFGQKHGSQLRRWEIQERILASRLKWFGIPATPQPDGTISGGAHLRSGEFESDETIERTLWRSLVFDVFLELESPAELFGELWQYFGQHDTWRVYDDVPKCWETLRREGWLVGLASNFDSRLVAVAELLTPLSSADFVFCSSQVGFRKPGGQFYRQVESAIACITGQSAETLDIYMVGDDFEHDYVAPRLAGWEAIWLDREADSIDRSQVKIPPHHHVRSLDQFTEQVLNR